MARWLSALAIGALAALWAAIPAEASCAGPPVLSDQLDAAKVVFVGTVVSTTDGGRLARVKVEGIWKGPSLPVHVQVSGSPAAGSSAVTTVDRKYVAGQRYLFVPVNDQSPFQDNSCTATQPYTSSLAAYSPADPRQPDATAASDPEPDGYSWLPLTVVVIVVLMLAAAASTVIFLRRGIQEA